MAFKEIISSPAISLGGVNKKTGVKNPTSIEGYYVLTRQVPDQKKKSGFGYVHEFQTPKGNQPVWGKTDFDRKIMTVALGTMVKVTWTGKTKPTPNGDMQLYNVQADSDNTITVVNPTPPQDADEGSEPEEYDSSGDDQAADEPADEGEPAEEEPQPDEQPVARPKAPAKAATAPNAARQAQVQALLKGRAKAA